MKKWIARLLRLWLVGLLPLGAYAAYQARISHHEIDSWQEQVAYWYPKLYTSASGDNSLAQAGFHDAVRWREEARTRESTMTVAAIALLTFPLYATAGLIGAAWIWAGPLRSERRRPIAVRPQRPH